MKKVEPYKSTKEAKLALDNGGRFFNFLTKSNDGVISLAELGKGAGVLADKQKMILFFDLSTAALDENAKNLLLLAFDDKLKALYKKHKPLELSVAAANKNDLISSNIIISGIPKYITSKETFTGFIMIPMMTGGVTSFTMIPLIDMYDVYEIKDNESDEAFLIAHAKSSTKLPQKNIKIAGIFKELKTSLEEENASKKFLAVHYYLEQ